MSDSANRNEEVWSSREDDFAKLIKDGTKDKIRMMQTLLGEGQINVNAVNKSGQYETTLLSQAVSKGDNEIVIMLMNCGADPIWQNQDGLTPLHSAARNGFADIAKNLVNMVPENHPNLDEEAVARRVNLASSNGWTPLHACIDSNKPAVALLLVDHHANVNARMKSGWTPLHVAAKRDSKEMAELLLNFGADKSIKASHKDYGRNKTPEEVAKDEAVKNVIRTTTVEVRNNAASDSTGSAPPAASARAPPAAATASRSINHPWGKDEDAAEKLIGKNSESANADLDKMLQDGLLNVSADHTFRNTDATLLTHSVLAKNLPATVSLLRAGADPLWQNSSGSTVMQHAAKEGHVDIGMALIRESADGELSEERRKMRINQGSKIGWTPLHSAVESDQLSFCKLLLESGADVNVAMSSGWTPLHAAAKKDNGRMVHVLLQAGADPKATATHKDFGRNKRPWECGAKEGGDALRMLKEGL